MSKRHGIVIGLCVAVVAYATWILSPHLGMVDVENTAGLTEADIHEIIVHLEGEGAFYGRGRLETILSSALDPRTRPHYFADVAGDANDIVVRAGYVRGPLWGGGPILRAKKTSGKWVFERSTMLWKS